MTLRLRPAPGTLTALLFENDVVGIPLSVFFNIEIPVEPFRYRRKLQKTSVRLEFIEFPVDDWRELAGTEFTFPVNPEPGYIDGSLYLDSAHNPADITLVRFGRLGKKTLPIALEGVIDFTQERVPGLEVISLDWSTKVTFDAKELDQVFAEGRERGAI